MHDNKLDCTNFPMVKDIQDAINLMPHGEVRDYHQACHDRFTAKLNGLPERVAAKLHMKTDHDNVADLPARQEVIWVLTKGVREHLGGNPDSKKE
jgi:hypothetical protein